jgi:hypothetical protein
LSHYYAKQMFLEQLNKGAKSYRAIRAKIKTHYKHVDVKAIRDELEAEGLISLSHMETRQLGTETKTVNFYQLCEPKLTVTEKKKYDPWDITLPSSIFTKQEKANMMSTLKMLEMRNNEKLQKLVEINAYGKA